MRFSKSLVCAAVAARAAEYYEDDDVHFMRALQSNSSNATTATPTTAAPTTGAPTTVASGGSSNATTTLAATTVASGGESSATTVASGGEGSGSGGESSATTAAPLSGTVAPVSAPAASNDTDANATVEVEVQVEVSTEPLYSSVVDATRRRRLAATAAETNAYNIWCGAFASTAALTACESLKGSNTWTVAAYNAKTYPFPSLEHCVVSYTYYVAGTACNNVASGSDGYCLENAHAANTGLPVNKACTKHQITAGQTARKYITVQKFTFAAATAPADIAVQAIAAKATAEAAADDSSTMQKLQAYMVASAAEVQAAGIAINFTEAYGMTDAQVSAVASAISGGSLTDLVVAQGTSGGTTNAAFDTATTALVASNPAYDSTSFTVAVVSAGTTTGSTSGAMQVQALAGVFMAILGLLFM